MRGGCLEEDDCTLCCCCRGLISEIGEDHWRRLELYCRASGIPVEVEFWNSLAWRSIQECKDFGLQEWQNFKIPWISAMKQRIPDGIPQVPDSRRKVTCPKESMDYRFLDCSLFSFCAHFFRPSRLNSLCGYCSIWCWGYKAPCSHLVHASQTVGMPFLGFVRTSPRTFLVCSCTISFDLILTLPNDLNLNNNLFFNKNSWTLNFHCLIFLCRKLLMRWTVLSSDALIFFPAALYFIAVYYIHRGEKDTAWQLAMILLNPCLIIIDHGHFQVRIWFKAQFIVILLAFNFSLAQMWK